MKHNTKPTPARRCQLAMARILTNIRQLLDLDPSEMTADLIEQHTALLQAMYRHHLATSAAEASEVTETSAPTEPSTPTEPAEHATPAEPSQPFKPSETLEPSEPLAPDMVRIPRKLKKKLQKLPDDHPLRRRYMAIMPSAKPLDATDTGNESPDRPQPYTRLQAPTA